MKSSSSSNSPVQILLVDDNKLGLAARKSVLEEMGYRITTATGADEALAQFQPNRFHLVVTDYRMPRMNGIELIRELRQRESGVPIILISGFVEALGLNEANTGADAVIQKCATEVGQLQRTVRHVLRRRKAKNPGAAHHSQVKTKAAGV